MRQLVDATTNHGKAAERKAQADYRLRRAIVAFLEIGTVTEIEAIIAAIVHATKRDIEARKEKP